MLDYIIIIPARYESLRFPGKPLAKINNKELILHVLERCEKTFSRKRIIVATDSKKIENFVKAKKYNVIMTSKKCLTGTDRIAEVSRKIDSKIYINVQGDEPLIKGSDIKKILLTKKKYKNHVICGMTKISSKEKVNSLSIPKVVVNENNELMYISRAKIPESKNLNFFKLYFKQVCIYAFSKKELSYYGVKKVKTKIEKVEDIEIIRLLEKNIKIKMVKTSEGSVAVDYPKDIKIVSRILNKKNAKK